MEGFSRIIVRSIGCAGLWLALLVLPASGVVEPDRQDVGNASLQPRTGSENRRHPWTTAPGGAYRSTPGRRAVPGEAAPNGSLVHRTRAILLRDRSAVSPDLRVGVGGLTATYKYVSGPFEFGGGMIVWGLRAMGGKIADPKLGVSGGAGVLHGNALRLNLTMGGLTLENSFHPDPRFGWRVGFGLGRYHLSSHVTKRTIHRGSFTYLEPMLTGILPLNRHLALEFAAGYTFAGATGVKIEGVFLQSEFLVGRF